MKHEETPTDRSLDEAVARYGERLFRFAFFRTGSRMDAEDIVQEAFLKWIERRSDAVANPGAYLFRMVSNGCADCLRRRPVRVPLDDRTIGCAEVDRDAAEESRRIEGLLERLPAEQAEAIRLHTYASLRFTEIAEVLDRPVTTVKSRFAAGIDRLKKMLNQ